MKKRTRKLEVNKRKVAISLLLILGFMVLEFPGIIIVGKMTEPMILGFPFLYVYIFFGWVYMISVMFYGYKTSWGNKPFFRVKKDS
ncbi:MAG: hypothetical protein KBS66_02680 [Eubacterium sp.]|nr:hypothetical protein [Candidatus Colimonas fimequi]